MLVILSGVSGAGKDTIKKELIKRMEEVESLPSFTSRNPRVGEEEGIQYHFITKEQFEENIKNGEMLEYAKYVDNYYGTPLNYVNEQLNAGHDVFLEIEVNGALQVRANCPDGVFIFLTPPDIKELRSRLVGRGTDDLEVINKRIQKASKEIRMMQNYDYAIVNDKIKNAVEQIKDIVKSERLKVNRVMPDYLDSLGDEI